MKHLFIVLSFIFILTACSNASSESDNSSNSQNASSADPLAIHYSEILDYYGQLYNIIDTSFEDDRSSEYYEGISENAKITLQTTLVYDQIDDLSYEHLSDYLSDEDIDAVKEINSNLYDATYNLVEIIKDDDLDKQTITPYLKDLKSELDISGVSSKDLNYFNLIRNPRGVAKENTEAEMSELIDQMLEDSKEFRETTEEIYTP
ncbi:hypothetical protein [Halobacillus sp. A5]|uniref:hypothetical protein n=1 Tax=Halobacillus sp. A5 TaxID=2880263 RepID=UPI0020A62BC9|nr:hypothetical protein [Halobacillus sp. A5]MCP3029017.1 hypothetical protein [Halobacillus sp. A5]